MKKLMNKIRKANKGFTLVELIIVIAIIAILTAVAAPQYLKYVDNSRWSQDQNNAQILLTAVQTAVADPEVEVDATQIVFDTSGLSETVATGGDSLIDYLEGEGWDDSIVVTNNNHEQVFTITISGNSVTGKWSDSSEAGGDDETT